MTVEIPRRWSCGGSMRDRRRTGRMRLSQEAHRASRPRTSGSRSDPADEPAQPLCRWTGGAVRCGSGDNDRHRWPGVRQRYTTRTSPARASCPCPSTSDHPTRASQGLGKVALSSAELRRHAARGAVPVLGERRRRGGGRRRCPRQPHPARRARRYRGPDGMDSTSRLARAPGRQQPSRYGARVTAARPCREATQVQRTIPRCRGTLAIPSSPDDNLPAGRGLLAHLTEAWRLVRLRPGSASAGGSRPRDRRTDGLVRTHTANGGRPSGLQDPRVRDDALKKLGESLDSL